MTENNQENYRKFQERNSNFPYSEYHAEPTQRNRKQYVNFGNFLEVKCMREVLHGPCVNFRRWHKGYGLYIKHVGVVSH